MLFFHRKTAQHQNMTDLPEPGTDAEKKEKGENVSFSPRLAVRDIAMIGVMVAVIEVCKVALMGLPNIETTSFWIILFTLFFGWKILFVIPVFILIEGSFYGVHLWWIMYLYAWPLLALLTRCFRKQTSALFWALLSGAFGLSFGFLCSFPYFFIALAGEGTWAVRLAGAFRAQFTWWVAGIPWDILHCVGNFCIMLVLYHPIRLAMKKLPYSIREGI